jgi:hypothetical protein
MYRISVDPEGDVVLDCGGRILAEPVYIQNGPLLPLGRPQPASVLPKRSVTFPLSQDFFSPPLARPYTEKQVDAVSLSGQNKDGGTWICNTARITRLKQNLKLGEGERRIGYPYIA